MEPNFCGQQEPSDKAKQAAKKLEEESTMMTFDEQVIEHMAARKFLKWGTYGKNGDQPIKYLPICELSNDHISAILQTQSQIWKRPNLVSCLFFELGYRAGKGILVEDG